MAEDQLVLAREKQESQGLRGLGNFREEQRERVLVDIFGELVEDLFETFSGVNILFLQGAKDTHQGASHMGASIMVIANSPIGMS